MTGRGTLRGRLALVAVGTTAAWVGLLTIGFNVVLASQLHAQASSLLQDRAAAAAAAVQVGSAGQVVVLEPRTDEALEDNTWIYQGDRAIERPRAGRSIQRVADGLAGRGQRFAQTEEPNATRLFALPLRAGGRQVGTIVTAVALDPYRNVERLTLLATAGLAVLLLAGVYAATRLLVGRALGPVQAMSQQAARWSAEDATQRFGRAQRPGELAALATNLDGLLDRLAALLRHEQQVSEELSHELRTPLALIAAETELLMGRRRSAAEREQAYARIAEATTQVTRILETLLTTARSRALLSKGRCVLLPVVRLAADRCRPPTGVQIRVSPRACELAAGVDAEVVERILSPLLDNAARYAKATIRLAVSDGESGVAISVSDDGPGVPAELGEAVFEPGRRGDDGHQGAGLGLALARRLARAAGGDLLLAPDGGFEVRLPRA